MEYEEINFESRDKVEIVGYESFWSYKEGKDDDGYGGVLLKLEDRTNARLRSTDSNLVNYWSSILRNEKPVFYLKSAKVLLTSIQS